MKLSCKITTLIVVIPALIAGAAFAEEPSPIVPQAAVQAVPATVAHASIDLSPQELLRQKEEELQALKQEHALMRDQLALLQNTPALTKDMLAARNLQRLKEIAADVKAQRQTMVDFEAFVSWMSNNLSGYSRYIEAGSVAAGFAKVLPIPYAGQASMFTKFVSQGILSLNAASVSINRYLATSQAFVARIDKLDAATPNVADVMEAGRFAEDQLLKDMADVQKKLASAGEVSASTLSFLESLNHYVGSTDEYWKKTKSFITRNDNKNEKSFLSDSIASLKARAAGFNSKLQVFEEKAKKDAPLIKTLGAYGELIRELDGKVVAAK